MIMLNGPQGPGGLNGSQPQRLNRQQVLDGFNSRVRRNHLIQDTVSQIALLHSPSDFRRRLRIIFGGEEGIDQGGLTKELLEINFGMLCI